MTSGPGPHRPSWRTLVARWSPVVIWSALLFALSAVPGTSYPSLDFSMADKLVHVLAYGPLGFFAARALRPHARGAPGRTIALAALLCALYGASDELHQAFVPFRSPDWRDLLADVLGGSLGAFAAVALTRRAAGKIATRTPTEESSKASTLRDDAIERSPHP